MKKSIHLEKAKQWARVKKEITVESKRLKIMVERLFNDIVKVSSQKIRLNNWINTEHENLVLFGCKFQYNLGDNSKLLHDPDPKENWNHIKIEEAESLLKYMQSITITKLKELVTQWCEKYL